MPPRILIVDDSRFARISTSRVVRRIVPECEIVEAESGEDALDILREGGIDFATIDLNMRGCSGIEVKETIDRERPGLNAVLITANVQDTIRARAEQIFLAFLEKPVSEDRLAELLKQHV